MIVGERAFGYVRINGPDDERLDSLRLEQLNFCQRTSLRLVSVFHDFDPEETDEAWLGFAHLLNALHQRPNSVLVIPDVTHLGVDHTVRHVSITCVAVAKAALLVIRGSYDPMPVLRGGTQKSATGPNQLAAANNNC